MKKLLQLNVTANSGSTGRIAEDIGNLAIQNGYESWLAYGRGNPKSESNLIRIGNDFDKYLHALQTRLLDNHGLASKRVTKEFINKIKEIKPDIIHLHNIHGYYLNYKILFDFLKDWGGPVVWTLHDCWPFTGHCAYYTFANCNRWKTRCHNCPEKNSYPSSLLLDRSFQNFEDKKNSFLGLSNLTLITVSDWLAGEVKKSFLKDYQIKVIKNGINLDIFKPLNLENFSTKYEILGVANVWDKRKGLDGFIKLRKLLPENYNITLVGLNKKQIKNLPSGIKGLQRTENIYQLVELYNKADVFVNPTLEDTFPTVNMEALACGIPVITYDTGGSPEAIDDKTGIVVPSGNINILASKIKKVCEDNPFSSLDCRNRAKFMFDKNKSFLKYIDLYEILLNK